MGESVGHIPLESDRRKQPNDHDHERNILKQQRIPDENAQRDRYRSGTLQGEHQAVDLGGVLAEVCELEYFSV